MSADCTALDVYIKTYSDDRAASPALLPRAPRSSQSKTGDEAEDQDGAEPVDALQALNPVSRVSSFSCCRWSTLHEEEDGYESDDSD